MATLIKTLRDKAGNIILPRTRSSAVTLLDGTTTLEQELALFARYGGVTTNVENAYSVATPVIATLVVGAGVIILVNADSTGAPTLNWSGTGVYPIIKSNGNPAVLKNGGMYTLRFDGLNFQLQGEGSEFGTAGDAQTLSGYTLGTENGVIPGTMPDNGSVGVQNLTTEGAEYTIPLGYHNGLGKAKAVITNLIASVIKYNSIVGGVEGTYDYEAIVPIDPTLVLEGYKGRVNGETIIGTMPERGTVSTDITTKAQQVTIAAGRHSGSGIVKISATEQAKIIASNIKLNVSVLGEVGSFTGNYATGTIPRSYVGEYPYQTSVITVGFQPKIILFTYLDQIRFYFPPLDSFASGFFNKIEYLTDDYLSPGIGGNWRNTNPWTITATGFIYAWYGTPAPEFYGGTTVNYYAW